MQTPMFMLSGFFLLVCAQAIPIAGKPFAQFLPPLDQLPEQNEDYSDSFGSDVTATLVQKDPNEIEGFFLIFCIIIVI